MSFLAPLLGGAGAAAGATAAAAPATANFAAKGLGHLVGRDPSQISSIANRIGMGANQLAAAGGAAPGYAAPEPQVNNHLQLLDPDILQALVARFRPNSTGVQF